MRTGEVFTLTWNDIDLNNRIIKINKTVYANPEDAFEFASWLSPKFKLYLITEIERLKMNAAYQYKIEWSATRILSKVNYVVYPDAVKTYIVNDFYFKK